MTSVTNETAQKKPPTETAQKKPPDDIDVLLDQVEKKYFKSPEAKRLSELAPQDCECTKKQETNWEEVDEILKDFVFEDTNTFGKPKNNSWVTTSNGGLSTGESSQKKGFSGESNQKCFRPLLAGSYEKMGYSEIGRERYYLTSASLITKHIKIISNT